MTRKWKITAMLFAIAALNYGDRAAIASVYPLLRADLTLSDVAVAVIGSAFLWSYAIGSPIAGYLADRKSRSKMVLGSLIAWSLVMASTGLAQNASQLIVMRLLLGIAECAFLPASIALIADHHSSETRATAIGFLLAGMNVGLIAGSTTAGYLGERLGWRVDFLIFGATGLLLALAASIVLADGPDQGPSSTFPANWSSVGQILRMPAYLAVLFGATLISIGTWIFLNWLPLFFYERFHFGLALSGFFGSSMLQVAAVLGSVVGGYLSDRFAAGSQTRRMALLSIGYLCSAPFLLTFLWRMPLGVVNLSVFLYSLIRAIGSAGESPIICEITGPQLRSTALGILNMGNCLAGGVGILTAGLLKRVYGLSTAFGCLAATATCAGMVVLFGYFQLSRARKKPEMPVAPREAA
jgi:MFS family permease